MSLRLLALAVPLAVLSACSKPAEQAADTSSPAATASSKSVDVARAYVDAWNKRDTMAIDTLIAADGTHEDIPWGTVVTGPAGVKGMMKAVLGMEPDFAWKATDAFENNSRVALTWTWTATFTGSDPWGKTVTKVPVSGRGTAIIEVENGKIRRLTDYYDNATFFPKPPADARKKS